eukprot:1160840-Pelagomonas_calceolata.AAC.8
MAHAPGLSLECASVGAGDAVYERRAWSDFEGLAQHALVLHTQGGLSACHLLGDGCKVSSILSRSAMLGQKLKVWRSMSLSYVCTARRPYDECKVSSTISILRAPASRTSPFACMGWSSFLAGVAQRLRSLVCHTLGPEHYRHRLWLLLPSARAPLAPTLGPKHQAQTAAICAKALALCWCEAVTEGCCIACGP